MTVVVQRAAATTGVVSAKTTALDVVDHVATSVASETMTGLVEVWMMTVNLVQLEVDLM